MRIRPWLKWILIIDAFLFVIGGSIIFVYAAEAGEWWYLAAIAGAGVVLLLAAGAYIAWDNMRR